MKWIDSSLKFITGALLLFSLIALNLFLVLYISLDYNVVSSNILLLIPGGTNVDANQSYYATYDCAFFDCLEKGYSPAFVISQHARDYWKGWVYASLAIAILLSIAFFFLLRRRDKFPLILGSFIATSSFPYIQISLLIGLVGLFIGVNESFISIMFSESTKIFFVSFVLGLFLMAIGFGILFFELGESVLKKFGKN